MEERVRAILDEVGGLAVPIAEIAREGDLFAAGLTSFATVAVMLGIEEAFAVGFPDRLLRRETFRSVEALTAAVSSLEAGDVAA